MGRIPLVLLGILLASWLFAVADEEGHDPEENPAPTPIPSPLTPEEAAPSDLLAEPMDPPGMRRGETTQGAAGGAVITECLCECESQNVRGGGCAREKSPQRLRSSEPPGENPMGGQQSSSQPNWKFKVPLEGRGGNCSSKNGEKCEGIAAEASLPRNQGRAFIGQLVRCQP